MAKRSLLLIVLGIAIGASMGFAGFYTPNQITFKILPTGKIYLAPVVGDKITWMRESGSPVQIFFPFSPTKPCSEPNGSTTCTVTSTGIFDYTCKDSASGGKVICTDPGIDPDPGCCAPHPAPPPPTPSPSLTTNSQIVSLQIGCDSSGKVSVLDSNSTPSPTINDGAIVQWTSPNKTFTISGISPASGCASSSLTGGVQWCTSTSSPATTVNYTVTVSGAGACTTPTGTFSFKTK
jgi:hypothetical protein